MSDNRSVFGLWLEAVTCEDPEWLRLARRLPVCAGRAELVDLWRSWSGHERHALRGVR